MFRTFFEGAQCAKSSPASGRAVAIGLALLVSGGAASLSGCSARGGAGANFSLGGDSSANADGSLDAELDAEASGETDAPAVNAKPSSAIKVVGGKLDYKGTIEFEYNRADLRGDGETQDTLAELRDFLKKYPAVKLQIEGHTDSRGSDRYNQDLSTRRAKSLLNWLVSAGVDADRLTSVGFGEGKPQVEEPDACRNKVPADTAPCEATWQSNRRVVFAVTGGAETVPEETTVEEIPPTVPVSAERPQPAPEPAPDAGDRCSSHQVRKGLHANALGPNSFFGVEFAIEPLCWLELSGGLGYGRATFEEGRLGADSSATAHKFNVPVRGRIWLMETHSLLLEAGALAAHYRIHGDENNPGGRFEYTRNSTHFGGFAGVGYGYRSASPFRIALILGGLVQAGDMDDSGIDSTLPLGTVQALQGALDSSTNVLLDPKLYGEISLGWLW